MDMHMAGFRMMRRDPAMPGDLLAQEIPHGPLHRLWISSRPRREDDMERVARLDGANVG
ncbi:hypothetical protein [Ensifer sp. Root1252]|uniref:hypothetical protein n=1 Tax=Ensifer sp. Root1252 TaxID=1736438 RepID=UPI000AA0EC9E|nr:hypothetical protein [Ensifer sp. Root1252]